MLERAPVLRETGAGIGIMPNGVLALDALGLGPPVRAHAAPLDAGGGLRDRHSRQMIGANQAAVQERAGAPIVASPRPCRRASSWRPASSSTTTPVDAMLIAPDVVADLLASIGAGWS